MAESKGILTANFKKFKPIYTFSQQLLEVWHLLESAVCQEFSINIKTHL